MSRNLQNTESITVDNSTEIGYRQSIPTRQLMEQKHDETRDYQKQDNYKEKTTLDALTNMLSLLQTDAVIHVQNKSAQDLSNLQNSNKLIQTKPNNTKKPKSKFTTKYSNFNQLQQQQQQQEQPYIITSSHKSFSSISSKNINKTTSNQQNNKLSQNISSKLMSSSSNSTNKNGKQKKVQIKQDKFLLSQQKQQKYHLQPISGISLYEQVLAKNFQVIDNLLKKLNLIYSHQQGYDKTMTQLTQKMHKLQVDNENIHHQFRTSHFMIDKKLNTISNDHANIMQDVNNIKRVLNYQGYQMNSRGMYSNDRNNSDGQEDNNEGDDQQFNQGGFSNMNMIKNSTRNERQKRSQENNLVFDNTNDTQNIINNKPSSHNRSHNITPYHRSAHKGSIHNKRSSRNMINLNGFKQHNLGKMLLKQINQSDDKYQSESNQNVNRSNSSDNSSSDQSVVSDRRQVGRSNRKDVQKDDGQNIKIYSLSDQNNQNNKQLLNPQSKQTKQHQHKGRKISKTNQKHHQKRHINSLQYLQINTLKKFISNQVQKVSKHNQQLTKFTLLGIQTTINSKCQQLQNKFDNKLQLFSKQLMQQKIHKQFHKSLLDQVQKIINNDLNKLNSKHQQNIQSLSCTLKQQIQLKCDKQQIRQDLKQILQSMNKKMSALLQNCYSKFAERSQTKRAILFLQKKINKLIQAAQKSNFDNIKMDDDNYQRVKCLSCNKSYVSTITVENKNNNNFNNSNINNSQSQPMLGQVQLLSQSPQSIQNNSYMTTTKKGNKNNYSPQNKHSTVRFRQLSKYNSVHDIFQTNQNSRNQDLVNINNINGKMKKNTQNPSYIISRESSVNKLKHSQTSQSLYLPSSPSNNTNLNTNTNTNTKSKYVANNNNTQQNKLPFSQNNTLSTSNIKQRSWKQKASTMLKKQSSTTINWRSKSQYKKV